MKVLSLLIAFSTFLLLSSCIKWPSVYIGDSSGIITYDRINHRLEVLWENHTQLKGEKTDTVTVDSCMFTR